MSNTKMASNQSCYDHWLIALTNLQPELASCKCIFISLIARVKYVPSHSFLFEWTVFLFFL